LIRLACSTEASELVTVTSVCGGLGWGVEEEDGCGLTRASGMAAVEEAAARSRSSERATKGSHHNEADTVLVPAPAPPPPPPEVEAVGPPLAMAGEQ
jgi:hypothetical protein